MRSGQYIEGIKLFVLDLDGTFYLGERILPGSLRFLERVRETSRRFVFFTNNSSRTPGMYIEKLGRMGVGIGREDIVTSGDVCIDYLNINYAGASVYVMGTEALRGAFADAGVRVMGAASSADGATPDVVVCAFDTELTYEKLERACTYIRKGAVFLATHEDINCPTEDGFIPDCGAMCAAIELSTGRKPKYLGKPHAETVEKIESLTGVGREGIAFIGDRLYTDVAAGVNNGATGILVLSGETKAEDVAASHIKPHAVFTGLGEIADFL
ncbi:MAG: HAD-IIA family hydrolase [Clostridiales bacterium]|nr:HAD-IIA family hydrolase [Clostridiales bacterium]